MNSNKTVRGIVALAMCVALTVSASAAYAHQAVGSLGTGYANVKSSTSLPHGPLRIRRDLLLKIMCPLTSVRIRLDPLFGDRMVVRSRMKEPIT